ncbi:MAG: TetR/AcrR family transcriptional regulator [Planctomycetia bacterium]
MAAAEFLLQTRGYDGFSYADLAKAVGLRKASIHHHFPTKSDLGIALIDRFAAACRQALTSLDAAHDDPRRRLAGYVAIFEATLADRNRMCLCGILALNPAGLSDAMNLALRQAIALHETWLTATIAAGQKGGLLRGDADPAPLAASFFACLEGAMLLSRVHGDAARFQRSAEALLISLATRVVA